MSKSGRRIGAEDITPEFITALPTLSDLGVDPGILEAAEALLVSSGSHGVELESVDRVVRLIAYLLYRRGPATLSLTPHKEGPPRRRPRASKDR